MRVLFVYSIERGSALRTPMPSLGGMQFGISYISAVLAQAGCTTRLMVLSSELEQASLDLAAEIITEFRPQLIAFTCVAGQRSRLPLKKVTVKILDSVSP